MNQFVKFMSVLSKIIEILHFIGAVTLAAVLILCFVNYSFLGLPLENYTLTYHQSMSVYGFTIENVTGENFKTALEFFCFCGMLLLFLMGMIYRNMDLILKKLHYTTHFSQANSPFQLDIIRMVREIGIFSISIPAVSFVVSFIVKFMNPALETSVSLSGVFFGLAILFLSKIFSYGYDMQKEMENIV